MATGGSGDVLAGLVAALLAQGMEPFDAACLSVHVHGKAGDRVSKRLSQAGLIAEDLPLAIAEELA
jgi:NAD(P)H-hydrate repair Nnr-like enzyme with NAD(P)H-hydrate dehydratase domain